MVIALSPPQRQFAQEQVEQFYMHLSAWEINPIRAALESIELPPTVRTVADWRQVCTLSAEAPEGKPITDSFAPLLQALIEIAGEFFDCTQVDASGNPRQIPTLKFLQHRFSKMG